MRSSLLACFLLLTCGDTSLAQDYIFEGPWKTTNRKLDGIMTCVVTQVEQQQWLGRFYGIWQGVPFDYTVKFSGSPSKLTGVAMIDGASYQWTGSFDENAPGMFRATFGGSRYEGSFVLKEKWRRRAIATSRDAPIRR